MDIHIHLLHLMQILKYSAVFLLGAAAGTALGVYLLDRTLGAMFAKR